MLSSDPSQQPVPPPKPPRLGLVRSQSMRVRSTPSTPKKMIRTSWLSLESASQLTESIKPSRTFESFSHVSVKLLTELWEKYARESRIWKQTWLSFLEKEAKLEQSVERQDLIHEIIKTESMKQNNTDKEYQENI